MIEINGLTGISNIPQGGIAATNVQAAINELDTETVKLTGNQSIAGIKTFSDSPLAPTPAQFDNTTALASTAFVRNASGNLASSLGVTAVNTLTAANAAGRAIALGGGTGYTTTLPLTSTVLIGTVITLFSQGGGSMVISRQGADLIYVGSSSVTSFTLTGVDYAKVCMTSAGYWTVIDGAPLFQSGQTAGIFGASKVLNSGYQKLPSGLIIQWGQSAAAGPGAINYTSSNVTFPIAFPNATLSFATSLLIGSGNSGQLVSVSGSITNTTTASILWQSTGTTGGTYYASYIAIGH